MASGNIIYFIIIFYLYIKIINDVDYFERLYHLKCFNGFYLNCLELKIF